MKQRPAVAPRLRELDRELAARRMPAGARDRIGRALAARASSTGGAGERRSFGWLPAATFVAGALLVFAVIAGRSEPEGRRGAPAVQRSAVASALDGFRIDGSTCRPHRLPIGADLDGDCRLRSEAMVIRTFAHAQLRRDDDVLRVERGTALFEVEHVRDGAPSVRVAVSHGVIEVIGTRFVVEQGPDGGHVDLLEGRILFHGENGALADIHPGQRHAWGSAKRATAQHEVEPAESSPKKPEDEVHVVQDKPPVARRARAKSSGDATSVIERVERLRSTGRAREAARLLRRALQRDWDPRTAQVLSFELGEVLHDDLRDREAACTHLHAHQKRYPRGRYYGAVERTLAQLDCKTTRARPSTTLDR